MHDEKIHYKMYKDGKQWAFAAIVTFTFTIVPMTMMTNHAAAASTAEPAVNLQNSAATSSSSAVTLSASAAVSHSAAATTNPQSNATTVKSQTNAASQAVSASASTTVSQLASATRTAATVAGQTASKSAESASAATPISTVATQDRTASNQKSAALSQTTASTAAAAVSDSQSSAKTATLDLKAFAPATASVDEIGSSLVANGLNDKAATFSVKDPEYPSSMYVDPNTNHYTFFWATSRNNWTDRTGEYNIVLSTDRSGSGILYVTILDSTNKIPLNEYTINEDDYEYDVETSKNSWSGVYLGQIYNDHYSGVILNPVILNPFDSSIYNWSPRFNVNRGGAVSDSNDYTSLSFMIPKLVTQTTSYVDDSGNQIAQSYVQQGLSGQIYTTTGGKVVSGYYETVPSNSSGYMSEFGKIGDKYTKDWHNGDRVDFTQTGSDGTMQADYYYKNKLRDSRTLTPSGAGSSATVKSGSGGTLKIDNIYIPQTRNVQYVYKKLGNLVIDSTDAAFDAAKKTKTQYANDPNDATRAADVTLPKITGFVPFINGVAVTDYTFNPAKYITSLDQDITVVYRAKQKARVDFIDQDKSNQVIFSSGTLTDYDGQPINFSMDNRLKQLVYDKTNPNGKYDLVKDGFPAGATYDHNANVDQVYQVVLKHHHESVNGQKTVKRTIEYYYQGDGQAESPFEQKVTFTRTGDRDRVTGATTWEDWSKVAAQNVEQKDSPKINGYTADKLTVAGATIKATDKDSTVTVTYVPNKQAVKVIYHDDTTNQDLAVKKFSGNSGADSGRNTKAAIAEYVKQHLKLVSDITNGQNIIFDKDDQNDQTYIVHFVHETETAKRTKTVTETIEHHKAIKQLDGTTKYVDIKNQIPVYTATLTFNESGVHDLYTDQKTWNGDWTPTQTFKTVVSPTLAGYTPDVAQVDAVAITVTDANYGQSLNVHHDIIYVGKSQILVVNYIDDTTHQVLEYWTGTGQSGQTLDYTTAATINKYLGQHYFLVSDATNGNQPVLDEDDISNNQVLEVHLKHQTTSTSRPMKVTEEIKYAYKGDANHQDGTLVDQSLLKQANPLTKELVFEQDGVTDNVTNTTTWNNDWKQTKSFKAVTTPNLKGYSVSVNEVPAQNVTIDAAKFDQKGKTYSFTVNYTPLKQTALIKYIDGSDNDKALETDKQTGLSNQKLDYTSIRNQILAKYANYEVATDETENGIVFNDDAGQDQIFKIVLKHKTAAVTRSVAVKQIIHFKFSDNHQQPWDQTSTLTFTQNGVKDLVTDQIDWDSHYSETQYFDEVTAGHVDGYTPDIKTIAKRKITVNNQNFVDGQFEGTITYSPNRQYISVSYIDDTTGKQLANEVLNGYSNTIAYSTTEPNKKYSTTELIKNYLGQGYELVSDSTNGAELKFDATDNPYDQVYAVHLKHGYEDTQRPKTVVEDIKYQYENGKSVKDPYHKELTFTQNGQLDKVTKTTDWNGDWTPAQTLAKVDSPTIPGYHYDYAGEPEHTITITNGNYDKDLNIYRTVTYYADSQNVMIVYVDKKTKNTIASESLKGKTGEHQTYSAQDFIAKKLTNYQNYTLVNDETQNGIEFPADGQLKVYYVRLGHETKKDLRTKTVTETIDYVKDGAVLSDQRVTKKLNFKQDGVKDLVNDIVDWNGTWTPTQKFAAVVSPTIKGYKAVPGQIDEIAITVNNDNYNQDLNVYKQVVYTANPQSAYIEYFDQDTGTIIGEKNLTGSSNQLSDYSTVNVINAWVAKGYDLVKDETGGQPIRFDDDDNVSQSFVVYLKHRHAEVKRPVKVQRVVHYVFRDGPKQGQMAASDYHDPAADLPFEQTGDEDLVTHTIVYDATYKKQAQFGELILTHGADYDAIAELIPGYHLNVNTLSPKTVVIDADTFDKASDGVFTVADTVYYIIDNQLANINYVDDDLDEKVVTIDHTTGQSGAKSSYDSAKTLARLIYNEQTNPTGQYDLVSDGTKDGIVFDLDDQVDQTFVVHLKHHILKQAANREKTIKQTVLYKYADGTQAADPYSGKDMTFKQTGDLDMVTGAIDWNGAWMTDERQGKFDDVTSPTIKGYTPDVTVLSHSSLTMDNDKYDSPIDLLDIVTYSPNDQTAIIKYVDIDNGGSLVAYDEAKGKTNEQINYDTKDQLSKLVYDEQTTPTGKYVLVSDGFAQALAAAQAQGQQLRFDNDDQNYQLFTIYLRHHYSSVDPDTDPASGIRKVSQIIHYVYQDTQQPAANDNVQVLTFKRAGYRDDVTGKVSWPLWETVASQKTVAVVSPTIKGYTPVNGQTEIGANEIAAVQKDDVVIYVNYAADPQQARINYVDQDTGQTIQSDKVDGVTDAKIDYSTADQIKQLINKGYVLVSDEFTQAQDAGKAVFDQDGNALQTFTVTLKHGTQVIDPNHPDSDNPILPETPINPADPTGPVWPAKDQYDQTTQAIVHYQDAAGNSLAPDSIQTARWTRTITVDKVTGKIIAATEWTSDPTEYATVSSPAIDGYTPDQTMVAFEMTPADQVKTVIYAKNAVPVEPEQPAEPSQPAAPSETVQPSIGHDSQSMQTSAESPTAKTTMKQLPQTGNDNDNDASWSIMGLLTSLLGMLGLAGLFKKKHDRG